MESKMLIWIRILTTNQIKQKQPTRNQVNPNHQKMDETDHPLKKPSHLQVGITKVGPWIPCGVFGLMCDPSISLCNPIKVSLDEKMKIKRNQETKDQNPQMTSSQN